MANLEAMARAWATEHYGEAHKLSDTEIGWLVAFAAKVDAEATERAARAERQTCRMLACPHCKTGAPLWPVDEEAHILGYPRRYHRDVSDPSERYFCTASKIVGREQQEAAAIRSTLARKGEPHAEG